MSNNAKVIRSYTGGSHIYMKLRTKRGNIGEIDVFLRDSGVVYRTTGDSNPTLRAEIIEAFDYLY